MAWISLATRSASGEQIPLHINTNLIVEYFPPSANQTDVIVKSVDNHPHRLPASHDAIFNDVVSRDPDRWLRVARGRLVSSNLWLEYPYYINLGLVEMAWIEDVDAVPHLHIVLPYGASQAGFVVTDDEAAIKAFLRIAGPHAQAATRKPVMLSNLEMIESVAINSQGWQIRYMDGRTQHVDM